MGNFIPMTCTQKEEMLKVIGIDSSEKLFESIPEQVKISGGLALPTGMSESEVLRKIQNIADKNKVFSTILRGAGAYNHYIPAIVKSVTSKEEFLTAYTPYQAEISQGILQSIFEYQSMICELTGMNVSNASVYDGATAAAEAVVMCRERGKNKFLLSETTNPQVIETIKTYCFGNNIEIVMIPEKNGETDIEKLRENADDSAMGFYLQQPNFYGIIEHADALGDVIHSCKGKFVMGVNPISLGLIKTPEEYGADIAVGEGQPLGMALSFGGPYLGFMATKSALSRKLPGRIVGQTKDADGQRAFVLTLQAREQHIRREKASSNICSNQALCAMTAAVYLSAMGADGIKQAANLSTSKAHYLAGELEKIGFKVKYNCEFFNEFVSKTDKNVDNIMKKLHENNILGGLPLGDGEILWCCTEVISKQEIDRCVAIIREVI